MKRGCVSTIERCFCEYVCVRVCLFVRSFVRSFVRLLAVCLCVRLFVMCHGIFIILNVFARFVF